MRKKESRDIVMRQGRLETASGGRFFRAEGIIPKKKERVREKERKAGITRESDIVKGKYSGVKKKLVKYGPAAYTLRVTHIWK
jgi:hypothetical protein